MTNVTTPLLTLLRANLRAWVSAKGFWLVAAAALLPLVFVGAWVATHTDDVAVDPLQLQKTQFEEGEAVRLVATVRNSGAGALDPFNVTLAVGSVSGGRLFPVASSDLLVEGLAPGETREIALDWNATPGVLYILATADTADAIPEIDEYNNQNATPILVRRAANESQRPVAPPTLAGDANATSVSDLAVSNLQGPLRGLNAGENATFTMDVTNRGENETSNANVTLRVARSFAGRGVPVVEQKEALTLAPGETRTITLSWTSQEGSFWLEGFAQPPAGASEATPEDNHASEAILVDARLTPDLTPPKAPEKLTVKEFYLNVLDLLYLRVLLPLIALFYASGVISDERERGTLTYLLTRPIPRWLIPLTKYVASFLVAAVATVIGLVLTYLLLFGTTPGAADVGFLTTPIFASLLTLLAYGAAFTLLGTLVRRPYLIGLAFVVVWEVVAPMLVSWVGNFTIARHIGNALTGAPEDPNDGWALDQGLQWLPDGEVPMRALYVVLAIIVGALILASANMRRREFET